MLQHRGAVVKRSCSALGTGGSLKKAVRAFQSSQPTQSQLCSPLLLSEVVPLVHPAGPGHPPGGELLVVLHHPVVVLHEDGAALGDLGPGVVLPALLLRPVQEHILAGQGRSHQSACQQKEPESTTKNCFFFFHSTVKYFFYLIVLIVRNCEL